LESAKNRSGMILLAEDESTLREAICETLIALGYRVKEAHDGAEALHLFQQHAEEIDLLITDAVMPNLGGVELIDRLRSLHSSVKAILMSGYANSVSSQTLPAQLSAGLIFLQKPFAQDELAKAVRRALSSNLN
jgi:CheY-like chemotaxis protein